MRVFKTKYFSKWAKKNSVTDALLQQAATEISEGAFDANLGGSVLKKRVATKNRGKRGSARTIIVYKMKHHCFFVYGFEKKAKDNISTNEEKAFKIVAKELLQYSDSDLDKYVQNGKLIEVCYE